MILAGAYYIYKLAYPTQKTEAPVVEVAPMATTTEAESVIQATTTIETNVEESSYSAGPNDAGMEWPILDSEVEAQ